MEKIVLHFIPCKKVFPGGKFEGTSCIVAHTYPMHVKKSFDFTITTMNEKYLVKFYIHGTCFMVGHFHFCTKKFNSIQKLTFA